MPVARSNIGMVFQNYALFPHMSVSANVRFGLDMRRVARQEPNCQPVADWEMHSTPLGAALMVPLDHAVGHDPETLRWAKNPDKTIGALRREHQVSEAFHQET